jgi:Zn finger protein HypA/HybF involved in hydrogenase expression
MNKIPDTEENRKKMIEVGDALVGTCSSLEDALSVVFGEENSDLIQFESALLIRLDDHTMQCDSCNWWCETGELDYDLICDDCREEDENDE